MTRLALSLLALVAAALALPAAERVPAPQPAGPIGFTEIVTAALADADAIPAERAARTLYLTAAHLDRADRKELFAVLGYHVNALSRGAEVEPLRKINEWLWAADADAYHWPAAAVDDLKRANHYYAIRVKVGGAATGFTPAVEKVKRTRPRQIGTYAEGANKGKPFYQGTEEYEEEVTRAAPVPAGPAKEDFIAAPDANGKWLPLKETAALIARTGRAVPLIRADEFLFQTLAQKNRDGHGYYDFLGLGKTLADAEKLAGLDRKKAIEKRSELAAVADFSGVALANRQLFRYGVIDGAWWESRDADGNTDEKNAIDHLHEDFKPDAFEIVFRLPNGMAAFFLANLKGERQDTAPDFIASNRKTADNDARVHVGYGCVVCHTDGGLHAIDDYMRAVYTRESGLSLTTVALDPERSERNRAYVRPIQKSYDRDTGDYAAAILEASGLKPAELSAAVSRQWNAYINRPVTRAIGAAEMGVTEDELRAAIERYMAAKGGGADPFVAQWRPEKARPMRREHFENRFAVFMFILGGATP